MENSNQNQTSTWANIMNYLSSTTFIIVTFILLILLLVFATTDFEKKKQKKIEKQNALLEQELHSTNESFDLVTQNCDIYRLSTEVYSEKLQLKNFYMALDPGSSAIVRDGLGNEQIYKQGSGKGLTLPAGSNFCQFKAIAGKTYSEGVANRIKICKTK